jgi:hypothetical protein
MMNLMRTLATAIVLFGLVAPAAASAGAVPKPPPKFWSPGRCERVLLATSGGPGGFPLPDGSGHGFHLAQAFCVGSGGSLACRWTTGHRSRLYSTLRVFTRSPLNGGVVRSFTLGTRAGQSLVPVQPRGGDQYAGWPPGFYMSSTTLLATDATAARFRSLVAPMAARLAQQENATACTGG